VAAAALNPTTALSDRVSASVRAEVTAMVPCALQMEKKGLKVMGFQEDNIRVLQKVFDEEWEKQKIENERRCVSRPRAVALVSHRLSPLTVSRLSSSLIASLPSSPIAALSSHRRSSSLLTSAMIC
jgi:hypothetical protein